jgi:hypothetical protein
VGVVVTTERSGPNFFPVMEPDMMMTLGGVLMGVVEMTERLSPTFFPVLLTVVRPDIVTTLGGV